MQDWRQLMLPRFGLVNLKRTRKRKRTPPAPRWTFHLDDTFEALLWEEVHAPARFAQRPPFVQAATAYYGLSRLAWFAERDWLEQWVSA